MKNLVKKKIILFFCFFVVVQTIKAQSSITFQLKNFDNIPYGNDYLSDKYACRVRRGTIGTTVPNTGWLNSVVLMTKSKNETKWNEVGTPGTSGHLPERNRNGYIKHLEGWTASWMSFESNFKRKIIGGTIINKKVTVEISKPGVVISTVTVRPSNNGTTVKYIGGKAYVTFSKPINVSIDVNGQMENSYTGQGNPDANDIHTICIFANPLYNAPTTGSIYYKGTGDNMPDLNNTYDAIVFLPGSHNNSGAFTEYKIKTNQKIYIPGDVIVHGTFRPIDENAYGWSVYGSGTISGANIDGPFNSNRYGKIPQPGVPIENCPDVDYNTVFKKNSHSISIKGIVVADPAHHVFNVGNSNSLDITKRNTFENLKVLAWRVNTDGMNANENALIKNCFFRCQDDVIMVGKDNLTVQNCVTWTDANGAHLKIFSGPVSPSNPNGYCIVDGIKAIYARTQWHFQHSTLISMRDLVSNGNYKRIKVKNVTVEDPMPGFPLFGFHMLSATGNENFNFQNIFFENIHQLNPNHFINATYLDAQTVNDQDNSFFSNLETPVSPTNEWFSNIDFKNCKVNNICITENDFNKYKSNWVAVPNGWVSVTFDCVSSSAISSWTTELESNSIFNSEISIFPNPTNSNITIKVNEDRIGENYELFDVYGKFILKGVFENEHTSIKLDDYSNGLYMLKVKNNQNEMYKFLKQ